MTQSGNFWVHFRTHFQSLLPSASTNTLKTKGLPLHKIDRKEVHYSLEEVGSGGVGVGEGLSHFERAALRKRLEKFGRIRLLRGSKKKKKRNFEIVYER
jgi:hypothetical protein